MIVVVRDRPNLLRSLVVCPFCLIVNYRHNKCEIHGENLLTTSFAYEAIEEVNITIS